MKVYNSLSAKQCNLLHPPTSSSSSTTTTTTTTTTTSTTPRRGMAWYICGPTVYDSAHLGHGRTYVTMDIFRRVALHLHNNDCNNTPRPLYVMNITDVDDKIIKRSMEYNTKTTVEVIDPLELARYYEYEFWSDMELLNVRKPDVICRVSEHVVDTIVPYIQQIVEGGMAYVIPEGGQEGEEEGEGKRG